MVNLLPNKKEAKKKKKGLLRNSAATGNFHGGVVFDMI